MDGMTYIAREVAENPRQRAARLREERRRSAETHPFASLSCVRDRERGNGRDFWAVGGTGNLRADWLLGEALAREALACMRRPNGGEALKHIVCGMVEHGPDPKAGTYMVAAFMDVVCKALVGAQPLRLVA